MLFAETTNSLPIGTILMYLAGGLAIFLFGMEQMSDALKLVAGERMRSVLARLTTNRFTGALAGAFVTSVIQSSSVTTVLLVGFISAGLMNFSQSIGVIMGANMGTTITAQIIAFKVTKYALLMVAVGFALLFASKSEKLQHYGHMVMGLGFVFFGMQVMSDGTKPLRDYEPFIDMMQQMDNPLWGILVAAAFTAVVQSSSATTGIIIVLAGQGFISLEAGIALIFGANIGTCVTAMLASIGKPREALRAVMVHVLFNVFGVIIWVPFISQLAWMVGGLGDTSRQIANAHTLFNVSNTLLFIWFTTPIAALVIRLVPERIAAEEKVIRPKYLDVLLLNTPSLALDVVRMELGRIGEFTVQMAQGAIKTVIKGTHAELDALEKKDNYVDALYSEVVTYLGRLSQENMGHTQSELLNDYLLAANYLESIGDVIETNLVAAGRERLKSQFLISETTQEILHSFDRRVSKSVENSVKALLENDRDLAEEVLSAKAEIGRLAEKAEFHLSRRLSADEPHRLAAFRLESEIIEYLKRMYYFAKRIAKLVVKKNSDPSDEASDSKQD